MRGSLLSKLINNVPMHMDRCSHVVIMAATIVGCHSAGPSAIRVPSVNPNAAAQKALEIYDKDANGSLDAVELAACPGLLAARANYDANRDGQVSRDEVAARLGSLYSSGIGLTTVSCRVLAGGQPLSGAKLRFVPEPFLAGAIMVAVGITDQNGTAVIAIENESLPADQRALRSMQPGIYRVEVEHQSVKKPAASLGCEIDPTSRGGTEPVFRL
jgi:hypothetical protein